VRASGLAAPIVLAAVVATAAPMRAQDAARWELAAGGSWTSTTPIGDLRAVARQADGRPLTLFETTTELEEMPAVAMQAGMRLSRAWWLELTGAYGTTHLVSRVSSDLEVPRQVSARERVQQWTLEAGLSLRLPRWRFDGRLTPFVSIRGGYLRDVHEARTLAESGQVYFAGAGVMLPAGAAPDDRLHVAPAVRALLFARF
jgi:hypothetical protein